MTIHIANIAPVALVASTRRTLLQILAGSQPLRIKEIGISFNDTNAALAPILVDVARQTDAGTASVTTGIIYESQESGVATLASARAGFSSTEPTTTDEIRSWYVTPAGGLFVMQFPLGDEPVVGNAGRLAISVLPGAGTTCSAAAYIVFDE